MFKRTIPMPISQLLPPEWAPQSGVMLTWPHPRGDWGALLEEAEAVFIDVTREIALRERVLIGCLDETHRGHVGTRLNMAGIDRGQVELRIAPSNDSWARDHGPLTVMREGGPVLLDFVFNGWGGKYAAGLDNLVTRCLHAGGAFGAVPLENVNLVLEGGAIDNDGQGTLLATRRCLLSPARNPDTDRRHLEAHLGEVLGATRLLWLEHGYLAGDDTDGHVDNLARFCDARTIAYAACDIPGDEHHDELCAMQRELRLLRTTQGGAYHLVPLPLPLPKYGRDGQRLPASYVNFLIINGAVLIPTYDDPADEIALVRLAHCFPGREPIGISCLALVQQFGGLHCIAMPLPAGVL